MRASNKGTTLHAQKGGLGQQPLARLEKAWVMIILFGRVLGRCLCVCLCGGVALTVVHYSVVVGEPLSNVAASWTSVDLLVCMILLAFSRAHFLRA